MKIVILDAYALNPGDLDWGEIATLGDLTIYERTAPEEVLSRCRDAEIVITNKVPFPAERIEQLPSLRMIAVMATGYNIIDTEAAHARGIVVTNIPAYSTASVAQMVMAQLLAITNRVEHYTRQITQEQRWTHNADFCYWDTPLVELEGKRIGIYGMGRIGMAVARIALAMGMEVVTCSSKPMERLPHGTISMDNSEQTFTIRKVSEEAFWSSCDIFTLHCPLTPQTHHLISAERLQRMKAGAIIINTSRGPVIDEQAVADALRSGRLAAFAADVLSVEPAPTDNPLLTAPNVFLTPHIAWATFEARTRLMRILTANIRAFIGGQPQNCV